MDREKLEARIKELSEQRDKAQNTMLLITGALVELRRLASELPLEVVATTKE